MNSVSFNLINSHSQYYLIFNFKYCEYNLCSQTRSELNYDENLNIYRVVALRNQNNPIRKHFKCCVVEKPYALYSPNAFSPDR